jgi:hypothetical protein
MEQKPILFFCVRNDYCKRFYDNYVHHIRQYVRLIDLGLEDEEIQELRVKYKIDTVPSLIVLNNDLESVLMQWRGGVPPDIRRIQAEMVMRGEYGC